MLPPGAMVSSRSGLLPRALSVPVALLQSGSKSMAMDPGTIEGHADVRVLGCPLGPCWYPRATLLQGP